MSDVLVWTDVETTGLDPQEDVILEVGMIATDYEANAIGVEPLHVVSRPTSEQFGRMGGEALHMHMSNGLIDECGIPTLSLPAVASSVRSWLGGLPVDGRIVLAGSSVHFDRRFPGSPRRARAGGPPDARREHARRTRRAPVSGRACASPSAHHQPSRDGVSPRLDGIVPVLPRAPSWRSLPHAASPT
jgi:hypothetical protein